MGLFIPTVVTLTAEGLANLIITWVIMKDGTPANIISDHGTLLEGKIPTVWNSLLMVNYLGNKLKM
jgi:hypothetical protein